MPLPGSVSGGDKRHVFQIPCEMQCDLDLLRPDYMKRETSKNKAIVLGFGATVQQKGNGLGVHGGGLLRTHMHRTLLCANIWPFCFSC